MKKLLLLAALLPFAAQAGVQDGHPVFSWTNPVTWSNGDTLTAGQITGYQLTCTGFTNVNTRIAAATGVPPSQYPTPAMPALPAGSYNCTLAVYGKQTPTSAETMSPQSNVTSFTVPQPTLNAPVGLSAT